MERSHVSKRTEKLLMFEDAYQQLDSQDQGSKQGRSLAQTIKDIKLELDGLKSNYIGPGSYIEFTAPYVLTPYQASPELKPNRKVDFFK